MQSQPDPLLSTGPTVAIFLRMPSLLRITGLGRSTIYRMVATNSFPRPVKIGHRAVAWRRSEVETWIEGRPVAH